MRVHQKKKSKDSKRKDVKDSGVKAGAEVCAL